MRGKVTAGQMGLVRGTQTMPAPRKYPKTTGVCPVKGGSGVVGVQRRAAESRPSKVISKAFSAAFHRWAQRLRPWPMGSRLMTAM